MHVILSMGIIGGGGGGGARGKNKWSTVGTGTTTTTQAKAPATKSSLQSKPINQLIDYGNGQKDGMRHRSDRIQS